MYLLAALITFWALVLDVHASGALAPRQSTASIDYYTPTFFCPDTDYDSDWTNIDPTEPTAGILGCYDTEGDQCFYHLGTGHKSTTGEYTSSSNCPSAPVSASVESCGVRCPSYSPYGSPINEVDDNTTPGAAYFRCFYNDFTVCAYDLGSDGAPLDQNMSDPQCTPYAPTTCPNARRSYKREDNFTALLRKKGIPARVAAPRTSY
ncbi:hypothetical protein HMN09_01171400 [Mycena chlorophos]|uniref:Uncharacterized protein n=1 Tax=Mycena chlorophos TaxID=658473 RepID=A0A8H6VVT8_MYCCL|nr:hypothetical protein HMN09_01171400 [Mycena chlorophos]